MRVKLKQNPPDKKKAWIVDEVAGQVVELFPSQWNLNYCFEFNGSVWCCSRHAIEEWDV